MTAQDQGDCAYQGPSLDGRLVGVPGEVAAEMAALRERVRELEEALRKHGYHAPAPNAQCQHGVRHWVGGHCAYDESALLAASSGEPTHDPRDAVVEAAKAHARFYRERHEHGCEVCDAVRALRATEGRG